MFAALFVQRLGSVPHAADGPRMSDSRIPLALERRSWPQSLPFYYGWVNVIVGSLAMTATLPGRTNGLSLVTESLLKDLSIDRVRFAHINLVASLVGAAFSLPCGRLIDRFGVRSVLVVVTLGLGLAVVGMSYAAGPWSLLAWLILVRGFGQSALSIVSIAAIGKWFGRRLGAAMGVFAVLLTFGFIGGILTLEAALKHAAWSVLRQRGDRLDRRAFTVPVFLIFLGRRRRRVAASCPMLPRSSSPAARKLRTRCCNPWRRRPSGSSCWGAACSI